MKTSCSSLCQPQTFVPRTNTRTPLPTPARHHPHPHTLTYRRLVRQYLRGEDHTETGSKDMEEEKDMEELPSS
jgi:hypothetical protein